MFTVAFVSQPLLVGSSPVDNPVVVALVRSFAPLVVLEICPPPPLNIRFTRMLVRIHALADDVCICVS